VHYPFILFMADTGARIGEASALQWRKVAADLATARIVRSFSSSKHLGPTKTGLERTVELSTRLETTLATIKPDLHAEEALVFPNDIGGLIDNSNFRRHVFNKIVRRMRLQGKRITPHSLRHTFASLHLSTGTNQLWVQRQGGWKSLSVLLDTYAHFMSSELTRRGSPMHWRPWTAPNSESNTLARSPLRCVRPKKTSYSGAFQPDEAGGPAGARPLDRRIRRTRCPASPKEPRKRPLSS